MEITILTENTAGGGFLAEHGLSYLVAHNGKILLFDTGHTDVFLKNAEALGINVRESVDTVVLSHGHWDHGNGLLYLKKKNLITHPAAFIRRFRKTDMTPVGLSLSRSHVAEKFRLVEITEPYEISSQIYYLGAIPRLNDFEAQTTPFTDEHGKDDFVPDDSALAVIQNNELIVISGCAHAGICNIIAHAKKITGISVVSAVIGGFHLKYNNLQTQKTVQYFKDQKISKVLPSHCTELPALAAFHEAFKTEQVKTGMVFSF